MFCQYSTTQVENNGGGEIYETELVHAGRKKRYPQYCPRYENTIAATQRPATTEDGQKSNKSTGCLVGCLAVWMAGCLTGCVAGWLAGSVAGLAENSWLN